MRLANALKLFSLLVGTVLYGAEDLDYKAREVEARDAQIITDGHRDKADALKSEYNTQAKTQSSLETQSQTAQKSYDRADSDQKSNAANIVTLKNNSIPNQEIRIKNAKSNVESAEKNLDRKRNDVQNQKRVVESARGDWNDASDEKDIAERALQNATDDLKDLENKKEDLEGRLILDNTDLGKAILDRRAKEDELTEAKLDVESFRAEIQKSEQKRRSLRQEKLDLESQIPDLERKKAKEDREIIRLTREYEKEEKIFKRAMKRKDEIDKDITRVNKVIKAKEDEITVADAEIKEAEKTLLRLKTKKSKLEAELPTLERNVREMKKSVDRAIAALEQHKQEIKNTAQSVETQKINVSNAAQRLSDSQKNLRIAENELREPLANIKKLENAHAAQNEVIKTNRQAESEKKNKRDRIQHELDGKNTEREKLEQQRKSNSNKIDALRSAMENKIASKGCVASIESNEFGYPAAWKALLPKDTDKHHMILDGKGYLGIGLDGRITIKAEKPGRRFSGSFKITTFRKDASGNPETYVVPLLAGKEWFVNVHVKQTIKILDSYWCAANTESAKVETLSRANTGGGDVSLVENSLGSEHHAFFFQWNDDGILGAAQAKFKATFTLQEKFDIKALEEENLVLTEAIDNHPNTLAELKNKLKNAVNELNVASTEVATAVDELTQIKSDLQALKDSVSDDLTVIENLKKAVQNNQDAYSRTSQSLASTKSRLSSLRANLPVKEKDIENAQGDVTKAEQDLSSQVSEIQKMPKAIKNAQSRVDTTNAASAQLKNELKAYRKNTLQPLIKEFNECDRVATETLELMDSWTKSITISKKERKRLTLLISAGQGKLDQVLKDITHETRKIRDLNLDLDDLNDITIPSLEVSIRVAKSEESSKLQARDETQSKLDRITRDISQQRDRVSDKKNTFDQASSIERKAKDEYDRQTRVLENLKDDEFSLEGALTSAEESLFAEKEHLVELSDELQERKDNAPKLENNVAERSKELSRAQNAVKIQIPKTTKAKLEWQESEDIWNASYRISEHKHSIYVATKKRFDLVLEKALTDAQKLGDSLGIDELSKTATPAGKILGSENGPIFGESEGTRRAKVRDYAQSFFAAYKSSRQNGMDVGSKKGHEDGYQAGKIDGIKSGRSIGYKAGRIDGHKEGYETGLGEGDSMTRENDGVMEGAAKGTTEAEHQAKKSVDSALQFENDLVDQTPSDILNSLIWDFVERTFPQVEDGKVFDATIDETVSIEDAVQRIRASIEPGEPDLDEEEEHKPEETPIYTRNRSEELQAKFNAWIADVKNRNNTGMNPSENPFSDQNDPVDPDITTPKTAFLNSWVAPQYGHDEINTAYETEIRRVYDAKVQNLYKSTFMTSYAIAFDKGRDTAESAAFLITQHDAIKQGNTDGLDSGFTNGHQIVFTDALEKGKAIGFADGEDLGFDDKKLGYPAGHEYGHMRGLMDGNRVGSSVAYNRGFNTGWDAALEEKLLPEITKAFQEKRKEQRTHLSQSPRLRISALELREENIVAGEPFHVDLTIENVGGAAAEAGSVLIELRDVNGHLNQNETRVLQQPLAPFTQTTLKGVFIAMPNGKQGGSKLKLISRVFLNNSLVDSLAVESDNAIQAKWEYGGPAKGTTVFVPAGNGRNRFKLKNASEEFVEGYRFSVKSMSKEVEVFLDYGNPPPETMPLKNGGRIKPQEEVFIEFLATRSKTHKIPEADVTVKGNNRYWIHSKLLFEIFDENERSIFKKIVPITAYIP